MGSTRCRHFVQNAWKKDLCSNCFKSKGEHAAAAPARAHHRQAVAPTPAAPPPQGILKGGAWTRTKAHRVYFPAEESEVIGEGGEDAGPPSDDDDDDRADDWSAAVVEEDPQELEEERMLQALTRSNTDFNSVAANLEGAAPPPAASSKQRQQGPQSARQPAAAAAAVAPTTPAAPLQLGKPLTDSQGRKQTLLVSVQPFGKPQQSKAPAKTAATDHVTTVVLKSTTPPSQGGKMPVPSSEVPAPAPAAPTPSPMLLKLNDAQATGGKVAPPLSSKHMFLKSIVEPSTDAPCIVGASVSASSSSALAVSKSAAALSPSSVPAVSKSAASSCSPVSAVGALVTAAAPTVPAVDSPATASSPSATAVSPAKATVSLTMPSLAAKPTVSSPKNVVVSPAVTTVSSSTTTTTTVSSSTVTTVSTPPTTTTTPTNPARREGKRTHITRGTPISKNNEMLLKTKFIPLRTSTVLSNNKRNSSGPEPPTLVKINGVGSEPVLLIESKQLDSSDEDERAYSNVQVQSGVKANKRVDENDAPSSQTKRLASLLAPLGAGVGSRELAGEPDGRADPDSSSESGSEPPALPQSPPPAVDPRPSFLHGLTARLASASAAAAAAAASAAGPAPPAPATADKPRVPYKSSAVTMQQQQRWSQLGAACAASAAGASPRQRQDPQQAKAAALEPGQHAQPAATEPPQAPSCSPPCSPESSPVASPHGTPPGDSCSRAQKRQAPKPPQEPLPLHLPLGALGGLGALGALGLGTYATPAPASPPPTPAKESSSTSTSPTRPALGRSASTGSSASPPSPVLSYLRKASLPSGPAGPAGQSPVARQKDKRRASQHVAAPLPPAAPARSESVPSALGQVALGHSVTLGAHSGHSIAQALAQANSLVSMAPSPGHGGHPQPSPRRGLSLSTDSLGPSPTKHGIMSYDTERKKPGTKVRFSLRKFLGLAKDGSLRPEGAAEGVPLDPAAPPQPRPRPRLEIIHPSDLSGRAVEVLRASGVEVRRQLLEQAAQQQASSASPSASAATQPRRNSDTSALGDFSPPPTPGAEHTPDAVKARPSKPPPPPRSQSLESDGHCSPSRPSRPPPPKSAHVDLMLRRHSASPTVAPASPGHSVYANVACVGGEMRTSVAPMKPQRTGSVRDASADGPRRTPLDMKQTDSREKDGAVGPAGPAGPAGQAPKMPARTSSLTSQPEDSGYESVELSDSTQPQSMTDSDNVYECVNGVVERSSSPECDSSSKRTAVGGGPGLGLGSGSERPASVSAQYCGSETESDIYSPYSFYGSDEGDDGESESWKWRSRARKGRSVVHKSMEDNYGAVVGANLEALAQLLEQIRTGPTVPTSLRPLKAASDLGWSDFALVAEAQSVVAGRWAFMSAHWSGHPVTLAVLSLPAVPAVPAPGGRSPGRAPPPFALLPIVEFTDRVASSSLPDRLAAAAAHSGLVQASVSVLARARVDTLASYGAWLQAGSGAEAADAETAWREAGLSLLQLFNALMALHGLHLGETVDPDSVVFLRDPKGDPIQEGAPQLALLHGMGTTTDSDALVTASLCRCALAGVRALLPGAPATPLLAALLEGDEAADEASDALPLAKAVLEYWLWGPAEAVSSLPALQRWLDLERATVLHRLVCARAAAGPHHRLAIPQQSHLLFLVHTTAPTMSRASRLLEDARVSPLEATS